MHLCMYTYALHVMEVNKHTTTTTTTDLGLRCENVDDFQNIFKGPTRVSVTVDSQQMQLFP